MFLRKEDDDMYYHDTQRLEIRLETEFSNLMTSKVQDTDISKAEYIVQ